MTTYADFDRTISAFRAEAKRSRRMTDAKLCARIGCSASSLIHKNSSHSLPHLPFWSVAMLAEAAGFEITFKRRDTAK